VKADTEALLRTKYEALASTMTEVGLRVWAAVEAQALGRGGVAMVARATGLTRGRVKAGLQDLHDPTHQALRATGRVRRPGAGRPATTVEQPALLAALDRLVEPTTRGDPMSTLRWTSKSKAKLAQELTAQGFRVSANTVGVLLRQQHYSLQAPRKLLEGGDRPDRDAQFRHIHQRVAAMQANNQPVVSVDCKKKELVGTFQNGGQEWQPEGQPVPVNVYDFIDAAVCKAIPYGA